MADPGSRALRPDLAWVPHGRWSRTDANRPPPHGGPRRPPHPRGADGIRDGVRGGEPVTPPAMMAQPRTPRSLRIASVLRDEFGRLYGISAEKVDPDQSFLALGADSLMLLRASRFIRDHFGVRVPFRHLLD